MFFDFNDTDMPEKNGYVCKAVPDRCEGITEEERLCACLREEDPQLFSGDCHSVSGNGVTGIFVEGDPI
jgi:hypothetical protein